CTHPGEIAPLSTNQSSASPPALPKTRTGTQRSRPQLSPRVVLRSPAQLRLQPASPLSVPTMPCPEIHAESFFASSHHEFSRPADLNRFNCVHRANRCYHTSAFGVRQLAAGPQERNAALLDREAQPSRGHMMQRVLLLLILPIAAHAQTIRIDSSPSHVA